MKIPRTQYAKSGDVSIAYSTIGDGPEDIVFIMGFVTHLELLWEEPSCARFLRRLASFARVILFDKRGVGLSDRSVGIATLEERADDIRAVMDAAGSDSAHIIGVSEGGPLSIVFAASHPDRTRSLIVAGSYVRSLRADDYPWAPTEAEYNGRVEALDRYWGRPVGLDVFAPSMQNDPHFKRWWANYLRNSATPGSVRALMDMNRNIDVRDVLPAVRTPTLILHRTADKLPSVEGARYMASRIPGARLVEFPGEDHLFFVGGGDDELAEIEQFVTGSHAVRDPDRVLATVLFTDIVDSTVRAAELGDSRWRDVLDAHHRIAAREITRYRGREVKSTGDGFLATFDGPARAVRCACAIRDAARSELNIELRAGLHTGEFEVMGDDIGGIAVHIGQRVSAMAGAGEVYVSSTVKDLTAGSGIAFDERGVHELKGVPGEWRIFAVAGGTGA